MEILIDGKGRAWPCERHENGEVSVWEYSGRLLGWSAMRGRLNAQFEPRPARNKAERALIARALRGIERSGLICASGAADAR